MNKNKIYLESDINLNKFKSVTLKQYNKDSQWLVINVTENGKPFIFGENDICIFKMKTPDGREIYNDAVIAENTIIVEITQNCCICSGAGEAELNIIDEESGSQIATMNFYVTIEESVYDNEDIEGSAEFGALTNRIAEADAVIAKTNEIIDNTTAAAEAAADSAAAAKASEENAKASEENAKASEMNAQSKMTAAENSANAAALSAEQSIDNANYSASQAQAAYLSAEEAGNYVSEASGHEGMAKEYSNVSFEYRVLAESYAKGGTHSRENEDVDNAKYYYEQARGISEGLQGSLLPMGTITFSQLENSTKQSGYMYNISNEFITDSTFKEGAGYTYPAGTNVYYTADGYWDCLAGTQVTGVKGNAESSFRKGNVNITPANIGALPADGDSKDNTVTFISQDSTNPTAWTDVSELTSGEAHSSIFNKISAMFKNIRYLYKMFGTEDISGLGDGTATGAICQNNTNLKDLIKIAAYTNQSAITIAANSSVTVNGGGNGIDMTAYIPSGYKAVGIASFIMVAQGVLYSRVQIDNNKLWYQLQNLNNSAVTLDVNEVSLRLLCVKNL